MRKLTIALLFLILAVDPVLAAVDLPDMGASSQAAMTPAEAQRLGKSIWRQLNDQGKLLDDPEVNAYLNNLGRELASGSTEQPFPFTFFMVHDPSINAFALPGGYIGVNTGLILATRREDELAAVLAHEIAHVTQHHIERGVEQAKQSNIPLTAAIVAAILLGARDPQMAQAAVAAGTASSAQMQLDFTRAHEREADRIGIDLLAKDGFDPEAMASFFRELEQRQRYYTGAPEFLRTHPVNEARIADAEARAASYGHIKPHPETAYSLIKARVEVLMSSDPSGLVQQLKEKLAKAPKQKRLSIRYALGLALAKNGDYAVAQRELAACVAADPTRIALIDALATAEAAAGNINTAITRYRKILRIYPENEILMLGLAKNLLSVGKTDEAVRVLEKVVRNNPREPSGYQWLGKAYAAAGKTAAAQLTLAQYYYALGETHSAIDQLKRAQKSAKGDFYLTSQIEARLDAYKEQAAQEKE